MITTKTNPQYADKAYSVVVGDNGHTRPSYGRSFPSRFGMPSSSTTLAHPPLALFVEGVGKSRGLWKGSRWMLRERRKMVDYFLLYGFPL